MYEIFQQIFYEQISGTKYTSFSCILRYSYLPNSSLSLDSLRGIQHFSDLVCKQFCRLEFTYFIYNWPSKAPLWLDTEIPVLQSCFKRSLWKSFVNTLNTERLKFIDQVREIFDITVQSPPWILRRRDKTAKYINITSTPMVSITDKIFRVKCDLTCLLNRDVFNVPYIYICKFHCQTRDW